MNLHSKEESHVIVQISFRGKITTIPLTDTLCISDVKQQIVASTIMDDSVVGKEEPLLSFFQNIKIIYKGKIMESDSMLVSSLMVMTSRDYPSKSKKNIIPLMAIGLSSQESQNFLQQEKEYLNPTTRIRDDLSERGKQDILRRRQLGRDMMKKVGASSKSRSISSNSKYGFQKIEILPINLPDQDTARQILQNLANDPGILACMTQHKWTVGCLAELYPEGKVGEDAVCTMGLNQNQGQKILLRIRTDDLKGFRKMLSIRKVLFHELAHNVYSEHDSNFFQLNRLIEKECNDLDWTKGAHYLNWNNDRVQNGDNHDGGGGSSTHGGTYRLGHGDDNNDQVVTNLSTRELAARAAMSRLQKETHNSSLVCSTCTDEKCICCSMSHDENHVTEMEDDTTKSNNM